MEQITRDLILFPFDKNKEFYYVCEDCDKKVIKKFSGIKFVFKNQNALICRGCSIRRTMLKKYGVTNCSQLDQVKEKKSLTKLEHFGSPTFNNRKKAEETELERYGGHHMTSEKVKEALKNVLTKKYGGVGKGSPIIKDKIDKTVKERYGVDNIAQSEEVKKSINKTCLKKYGTKWALQNREVIDKRKETCLKKYGVDNSGFLSKPQSYIYKNLIFDSSWELAYWIWHEDNSIPLEKNMDYFIADNGRKVYPDFKKEGKYIEIKGNHLKRLETWSYKEKCYKDNNVQVLFWEDIKQYVDYVENKYGKAYLKSFLRKKCIKEELTKTK